MKEYLIQLKYAGRLGRSAIGYLRMTEVSQQKTSASLSASECQFQIENSRKAENGLSESLSTRVLVLNRKFLEGRKCVCSTRAYAINMCLKMKDQTSKEKMLTQSGQYFQPLLSPETIGITRTKPKTHKTLHPETHCLLPISPSKR